MASEQLTAYASQIHDVLKDLDKILYLLDNCGFAMSAIHIDSAIHSLNSELPWPNVRASNVDLSFDIDFSTLDAMALSLFS